jgi:hypothetical protein
LRLLVRGSERHDERGNLADQAVANRELRIELESRHQVPVVLDHADVESAKDVDKGDDQPRDGVTAHEFGSTVHGSIEVGFLGNVFAALAGLGFVNDASVQIGVDGHLLAGHGVEREPSRDFRDPRRAFGDYDELNHEDDDENDDADGERTGRHEAGECVHHFAGTVNRLVHIGVTIASRKNQPRGGDIEHQSEEGHGQQQ